MNKTRMLVTATSPTAEVKKVPNHTSGHFQSSDQHDGGTNRMDSQRMTSYKCSRVTLGLGVVSSYNPLNSAD